MARVELPAGRGPEVARALALAPHFAGVVMAYEEAVAESTLDPRLHELVRYRIALINQCTVCLSYRREDSGVSEALLGNVAHWRQCDDFTDAEKAALDFTEQFCGDSSAIGDELVPTSSDCSLPVRSSSSHSSRASTSPWAGSCRCSASTRPVPSTSCGQPRTLESRDAGDSGINVSSCTQVVRPSSADNQVVTKRQRASRRGITRGGGAALTAIGLGAFFGGGALFAFASVDQLWVRLFVFLSLAGLLTVLVGLKNVVHPSARNRQRPTTPRLWM